jgi:hypothetical protein
MTIPETLMRLKIWPAETREEALPVSIIQENKVRTLWSIQWLRVSSGDDHVNC